MTVMQVIARVEKGDGAWKLAYRRGEKKYDFYRLPDDKDQHAYLPPLKIQNFMKNREYSRLGVYLKIVRFAQRIEYYGVETDVCCILGTKPGNLLVHEMIVLIQLVVNRDLDATSMSQKIISCVNQGLFLNVQVCKSTPPQFKI